MVEGIIVAGVSRALCGLSKTQLVREGLTVGRDVKKWPLGGDVLRHEISAA